MKRFFTILLLLFSVTSFGQSKKVLFEEFTNASCAPCAANNPALKDFIDSKGDTIIAIKYHTNFPGFDPMYNANPAQVEQRRTGYYADVNAVPWLKGDGDMFPDIWPFTLANFNNAFNTRKSVTPLLTMSVTDQRIPGDSLKALVTVTIPQDLPAGNYKLRVMAVEGVIEYANPPGSNGERIFEHVFRKGYPDMNGTSISIAAGTHVYEFRYSIESDWNDAEIYTVAFVQNDASQKEVLNCASGETGTTGLASNSLIVPEEFILLQNYPNPFNPSTVIGFTIPERDRVSLKVYDMLGREIKTLINGMLDAGSYEQIFDASNEPAGIYYYTLQKGQSRSTKSMVLLK